jgi:superfamily II DNA helicase RecQ
VENDGNFSNNPSRKSNQRTTSTNNVPKPIATSNHNAGLTFRVRGSAPLSTNISSEGSVGWMNNADGQQEDDNDDEEEKLRQELKKAKKKQKQRDKLQQWTREKEEKALQDLKAQEEEKKAMQEAGKSFFLLLVLSSNFLFLFIVELLREARRKEYVQKQKQKLASYQDVLKTEKEKIQELINLGIDPKSLNL